MPLQNRVTPFGEIVAHPAKGTLMGNRGGRLHDPQTRTLLPRRWVSRAWIACLCDFNGRRRTVMGPDAYTELFFLDEATALAAGHRPCFECRRADARAFAAAFGGKPADAIDRALHAERLDGRAKRLHQLDCLPRRLPDGAMIADGGEAFLVWQGRPWRWSFSGYARADWPARAMLLTPPSIVAAMRNGYRPGIHASAAEISEEA